MKLGIFGKKRVLLPLAAPIGALGGTKVAAVVQIGTALVQ